MNDGNNFIYDVGSVFRTCVSNSAYTHSKITKTVIDPQLYIRMLGIWLFVALITSKYLFEAAILLLDGCTATFLKGKL
jgi:hypothetical protein